RMSVFVFFFQAEDGIRDFHVTGVQTCALPILGNATVSRLSILIAILIGTLAAAATGQADFSHVTQGDYFGLPSLFHFGWPTFHVAAIVSMFIVIIVTLVETSADILAVGDIIDTRIDSR